MKASMVDVACLCLLYVLVQTAGLQVSTVAPPIIGHHDGHRSSKDDPGRLGRPDGHERHLATDKKPIFGGDDGHERPLATEEALVFGRDDGHERRLATERAPVFGGEDGHERPLASERAPVFGGDDGHERPLASERAPVVGEDDGHELNHDGTKRLPEYIDVTPEIGHENHESHQVTEHETDEDVNDDNLKDDEGSNNEDSEEKERVDDHLQFDWPAGHDDCSRRPQCRMYCEHGFQTDEMGCHICKCLSDPCESLSCPPGSVCRPHQVCVGKPCTHLTARCHPVCSGPEPMCSNICPHGYKLNDQGCMTCDCKHDCPTPMCEVECPNGYKTSHHGCPTCHCNHKARGESCMDKYCEVDQVCRKSLDKTDSANCVPKPLCKLTQEVSLMVRGTPTMYIPKCDADGSFQPLQCDQTKNECWCVDDRGQEVNGSKASDETKKPKCERKTSEKMNIRMYLVVTHHINIILDKDSLSSMIVQSVSAWLLMEPDFVKLTKIEPQVDSKNASQTLVLVELVAVHYSITDLPSAAEYMRRHMKQNDCNIPLPNGGVMKPNPDSVETIPTYPAVNHDKQANHEREVKCFGYRIRRSVLITMTVALGLIVLAIVLIFLWTCRSRRMRRTLQFKHHQFVNQMSLEKPSRALENVYWKSGSPPDQAIPLDDKVPIQV